ncbi:MAG: hypothetical protein ACOC5K_03075 [Chloroflexota bacterium]
MADLTSITGRLRKPVTADVREDGHGRPTSIRLHNGRARKVSAIRSIWKINHGWWQGPEHEIARVYFELLLEDGRVVTVFRDLVGGGWRMHR